MAGWFEGYPLAYNRSYTHLRRDFSEILSRKWGSESSFLVIVAHSGTRQRPDRKESKDNTPLEMVFRQGRTQTLGFTPDAFKVDSEQREITLYEVEDSHRLTIRKLSIIVNLWWVLDDIGWALRLIVVDRYAAKRKELDLHEWSYLMDRYQLGLAK